MRRFTPLLVIAFASACSPKPPSDADYVARITSARAAKDAVLRSEPEPIPARMKSLLLPLLYYPVDPGYDVAAELLPSENEPVRPMVYSNGAVRDVRRVGTLKFLLNARELRLSAFVEVGASNQTLFIPFGDLTNGTDTYPGGRLLETERNPTGLYDLDFNSAHNPTCYYAPGYSCPVPPGENKLQVPILAGERVKVATHEPATGQ